jgi:hypothetical protein
MSITSVTTVSDRIPLSGVWGYRLSLINCDGGIVRVSIWRTDGRRADLRSSNTKKRCQVVASEGDDMHFK